LSSSTHIARTHDDKLRRHMLLARNESRECDLMNQGRIANRPWSRMRGLIGSLPLSPGQGLWITPCNGIHMMFMSFPIDVVYLGSDLRVVGLDEDMRPWRLGRFVRGAQSVIELPAGTIASSGTAIGDQIALERRTGDSARS